MDRLGFEYGSSQTERVYSLDPLKKKKKRDLIVILYILICDKLAEKLLMET